MAFIDARRVQADGLVVCDVAIAFAVLDQKFGVEGPGNDGGGDEVVGCVDVGALWEVKELPAPRREACFVEVGAFGFCEEKEARVDKRNNQLTFKIFDV